MKVTDDRTITVELDGEEHKLTIAEAQRLYDALGALNGVRRHGQPSPYFPQIPQTPIGIGGPYSVPSPNVTPGWPGRGTEIWCSTSGGATGGIVRNGTIALVGESGNEIHPNDPPMAAAVTTGG